MCKYIYIYILAFEATLKRRFSASGAIAPLHHGFAAPFPHRQGLATYGTKYLVLGTKYLVLGTKYLALGTEYLVLGTKYVALGTEYLVPST